MVRALHSALPMLLVALAPAAVAVVIFVGTFRIRPGPPRVIR
jgi:hypothetical protein